MSGFAIATGTDAAITVGTMLDRIRHRGSDRITHAIGTTCLGVLNRPEPALFQARIGRAGDVHVIVEGRIDEEGDWLARHPAPSLLDAIARAVLAEGDACLTRLRGAFVVAVVWEPGDRMVLLRDPMGLRPAYAWVTDDAIVAASEVKAVLAHPNTPRDLDPTVLGHLLVNGLEPSDRSLARGVRKLPPGHRLDFERGRGGRTALVSRLIVPPRSVPLLTAVDRLQAALDRGFQIRSGDVGDVGLFLSGGLDSYVLGERLVRAFPGRVRAGTAGVSQGVLSEISEARIPAAMLGVPHVVAAWPNIHGHSPDLASLLATAVERTEQPGRYGNAPLLVHLLAEWKSHPRTLVTGDAADGLFGDAGFRRFSRVQRLAALPGRRTAAELVGAAVRQRGRAGNFARLLRTDPGHFSLFVAEVFAFSRAERLLGFNPTDDVQAHYDTLANEVAGSTPEQRYSYLYLRGAGQGYIDKLERIAAAAGADLMHPFLFPEVVDLAMELPGKLRQRNGRPKPIIVDLALRSASPEMVYRKKQGFGAPRTAWLRTDPSLRDVLATLRGPNALIANHLDRAELASAVRRFETSEGEDVRDTLWILVSAELWSKALFGAP